MMKRTIVIGIVVVMVMCLAVAASAITVDDTIKMGLVFENEVMSQGILRVGTTATAIDGYFLNEDLGFAGATAGAGEIIATDLAPVAGVAPTGRWATDLREKITLPNQCKVWHLLAYVNGGALSYGVGIKAWVISTGVISSTDYIVELYSGTWTTAQVQGGQAGTALWTAPYNSWGSVSSWQYTGARFALEANGSRTYTVSIQSIPEPGSMIALFCGLIGLVGFRIRRLK